MNHRSRYKGETFYQSSFKPGDKTSILLVVENPALVLPYAAVLVTGFGLLIHFHHAPEVLAHRGARVASTSRDRKGAIGRAPTPGFAFGPAVAFPAIRFPGLPRRRHRRRRPKERKDQSLNLTDFAASR
jgi:hypothetical protein